MAAVRVACRQVSKPRRRVAGAHAIGHCRAAAAHQPQHHAGCKSIRVRTNLINICTTANRLSISSAVALQKAARVTCLTRDESPRPYLKQGGRGEKRGSAA